MSVTVELVREKETKTKVRFQESGGEDRLGMVYIPKDTLASIGNPDRLTITVDALAA